MAFDDSVDINAGPCIISTLRFQQSKTISQDQFWACSRNVIRDP